MRRTIR